eukprot:jgi/Psemu1/47282/gm1.47282_g
MAIDYLHPLYDAAKDFLSNLTTLAVAKYAIALSFLLAALAYFVLTSYQRWEEDFSAGTRVHRDSRSSPSNKQRVLGKHRGYFAPTTNELIFKTNKAQMDNSVVRERAKRRPFHGDTDTNEAAAELHMDHVYIKFSDFLWGLIFVGINARIMSKVGIFVLGIRETLTKWGIIKVPQFDIESLIATLCLEQSQVIHYSTRAKKDSELCNILAGFCFPNFPYVENENLEFKVADIFAVEIDLNTKRFVNAKLDNENLTPMQTLILLVYNTIATQHVKLHAMANWGVNGHASIKAKNPFLHQNSIVTIIYNYLGYTSFSGLLKIWEEQGFLGDGWAEKGSLIKCINHGISEGICQHPHIQELINDSQFVHFAIKALFVGTILHSLDHTFFEWNLCDPLWLDVNEPRFGEMAKLGRIRFKGSGHPFYEEVYRKAAKINKKLADHMDTCIVK